MDHIYKKINDTAFIQLFERQLTTLGIDDIKRRMDYKGDPKDEFMIEFKDEKSFVEAIRNPICIENGTKFAVIPHQFKPRRCKICHQLNNKCKDMDRCGNEHCERCGLAGNHYKNKVKEKCKVEQNKLICLLCNKNHPSYSKNCKILKRAKQDCNRIYFRILNKAGIRSNWLDKLMEDDIGEIDEEAEIDDKYVSILDRLSELEKARKNDLKNQEEINKNNEKELKNLDARLTENEIKTNDQNERLTLMESNLDNIKDGQNLTVAQNGYLIDIMKEWAAKNVNKEIKTVEERLNEINKNTEIRKTTNGSKNSSQPINDIPGLENGNNKI